MLFSVYPVKLCSVYDFNVCMQATETKFSIKLRRSLPRDAEKDWYYPHHTVKRDSDDDSDTLRKVLYSVSYVAYQFYVTLNQAVL